MPRWRGGGSDHAIYGHMNEQALHREVQAWSAKAGSDMQIQDISSFSAVKEAGLAKLLPNRPRIAVGMGTCGNGNGARGRLPRLLRSHSAARARRAPGPGRLLRFLRAGPLVNVWLPATAGILRRFEAHDVDRLLDEMAAAAFPHLALCKIEDWDHLTAQVR